MVPMVLAAAVAARPHLTIAPIGMIIDVCQTDNMQLIQAQMAGLAHIPEMPLLPGLRHPKLIGMAGMVKLQFLGKLRISVCMHHTRFRLIHDRGW